MRPAVRNEASTNPIYLDFQPAQYLDRCTVESISPDGIKDRNISTDNDDRRDQTEFKMPVRPTAAVRAKLKGGKMRYVPMSPELAGELRRYLAVINDDGIFPPKREAKSGRQRVEGSFEDLLERAKIEDFRFHDLRHTLASWYMMNGGDLRAREDPRPRQYKDDRTLCEAGAETYRENRLHGAGNLETDGNPRLGEHPCRCSRIVRATETVRFWLIASC